MNQTTLIDLSTPPINLKSLKLICKCAKEHEKEDVIIAYYCRMYAVEIGMQLQNKCSEDNAFLSALLDFLDQTKKNLSNDLRISNKPSGQAYVNNYAIKLFTNAFEKDKASDFGTSTVKSFLTAGILMDVLKFFGDVSEEIDKARKYAKYKAVYITQTLKNGEVPVAGPSADDDVSILPDLGKLLLADKKGQEDLKTNSSLPKSKTDLESNLSTREKKESCFTNTKKAIQSAKLAINCLEYQDRENAIKYLNEALEHSKL